MSPRLSHPAIADWLTLGVILLAPVLAGRFDNIPAHALNGVTALAALLVLLRPTSPLSPCHPVTLSPCQSLGAALLALAATASVIPSVAKGPSLVALSSWLSWIVLFGLVRWLARSAIGRERVVAAVALAALLVSALALREYVSAVREFRVLIWRTFGPFAGPNVLASFLAMTVPLLLARALAEERRGWATALGGIVVLELAALPLTGSRGGLLALGGGLAAMGILALLRREWPDRRALGRLAIIMVLGLPAFALLSGPIAGRIQALRSSAVPHGSQAAAAPAGDPQTQSNQFRRLTWQSTARMARAHPVLGTGIGTFKYAHARYAIAGFTEMAHQSYLQIAAETGALGLLGLLMVLAGAAWSAVRAAPGEGGERWLAAGLGGGIAASAAHNVIDYSWYVYGTAVIFWAMVGLLSGLPRRGGGARQPQEGIASASGRRGEAALTPSPSPNTGRGEHSLDDRTVSPSPSIGRGGQGVRAASPLRPGWDAASITLLRPAALFLLTLLLFSNLLLEAAAGRAAAADAARDGGDLAEAVEGYRGAVALFPLDPGPHLALGDLLLARGDGPAALAEYRAAVRWAPTRSVHYYRLGRALARLGQPRTALEVFRRGLAWDPNSVELLTEVAKTEERAGDRDTALHVYRRIVAMEAGPVGTVTPVQGMRDHRWALAHEKLGEAAETAGHHEEACREFEGAAVRLRQRRLEMKASGMLKVLGETGRLRTDEESELREREAKLWERVAACRGRAKDRTGADKAARFAAEARADHPG